MEELEQLSHEIMDAIRTRNRRTLEAVLVADFVQIDERGHRIGKEAFITAIETGEFQIEELRFEWLLVDQFGQTAVVCGVQGARVRLPTGECVEGRTAFTDVFVRAADGWRLRLATSAELGQGGMA